MGVLADIYSGGNTLKRRLNALIKDPAETLGLGVTRFGEDQNQLINLLRNAYPMAGEKTVLNSPQQMAQFRGELADKGAEQAMAAATVWHGSPHKFDKFDSSKIGTGEGAQAYGHGLYLAESPGVAQSYQRQLAATLAVDGKPVFKNGQIVNSTGNQNIDDLLLMNAGDMKASSKNLLDELKDLRAHYSTQPKMTAPAMVGVEDKIIKGVQTDLAALRNMRGKSNYSVDGQLYKVDLPDEQIAKMLDYDLPIGKQSPEVLAALNNSQLGKTMAGAFKSAGIEGRMQSTTVGNALKMLKSGTGADAAEQLRQAGIPGIRYLDGGSRGAGAGSSNFVVFPGNENMLSIMERNGQPVLNKLLGK